MSNSYKWRTAHSVYCTIHTCWEIICNNPDIPWEWNYIVKQKYITWDIVVNHLDPTKFRWTEISYNPNITWEIICNNPDREWRFPALSQHPNITWEIIRDNPDKNWNWTWMTKNPNITWEIVRDNPDKPWCMNKFAENPSVTWEIIKKFLAVFPDDDYISTNPNITYDIVRDNLTAEEKYRVNWNWRRLGQNKFNKR